MYFIGIPLDDLYNKESCTSSIKSFLASRVLTPTSHVEEWLIVKAQVEQTAIQYCQGKIHLGGIHFVTTVYCLTFRRHLSGKHPLYNFFKYHCEGTVPHVTLTSGIVTDKGDSIDKIFSVGANGNRNLARKAFEERDYETFTYDWFIKVRFHL